MIDLDREMRALLEEDARQAPPLPEAAPTLRRARHRQLAVVVAALAMVATLAVGSIAGVAALVRSSERQVPAKPEPAPLQTPSPEDVGLLAAVSADETWATTGGKGAWRLDGDTWTFFGEATGAPWHRVNDIAIALDGTPWVATDRGIASFEGSDWTTVESGEYSRIAFGPNDEVWTAGPNNEDGWAVRWGGWRIRQVGGTTLPGPGQLEWGVSSLAVDQSGGVWEGSAGWRYSGRAAAGGLVRFDGEGWREMEPVAGVDEFLVQDIEATANGDVWVSVLCLNHDLAPVVARYRDGAWTTFRDAEGRPFVGALEGGGRFGQLDSTPDGDVLLTTSGGVVAFRDGVWTRVREGTFRLLSVAPDGTVWLAGDGLFRIPAS